MDRYVFVSVNLLIFAHKWMLTSLNLVIILIAMEILVAAINIVVDLYAGEV